MRIAKSSGWTSCLDLAKARSRLRGSSLGFSLSSPHQRDRFSLSYISQRELLDICLLVCLICEPFFSCLMILHPNSINRRSLPRMPFVDFLTSVLLASFWAPWLPWHPAGSRTYPGSYCRPWLREMSRVSSQRASQVCEQNTFWSLAIVEYVCLQRIQNRDFC